MDICYKKKTNKFNKTIQWILFFSPYYWSTKFIDIENLNKGKLKIAKTSKKIFENEKKSGKDFYLPTFSFNSSKETKKQTEKGKRIKIEDKKFLIKVKKKKLIK